jgi:Fasciclin domain/Cadherin-like
MMNKIRYIKIFICTVILSTSITSCEKFSLLKSEDVDHQSAGLNLRTKTIWQFLSDNNFQENQSTNIGLFGKAIQHAGLKDLLNDPKQNLTVIIPSNDVLQNFITGLGYAFVEDVPPIILRNILLNNMIEGRVRSFDLEIGVDKSYPSLSNDSLYLTRTTAVGNEYVLTINSSPNSNSVSASVRTQNLEFVNGVAHVVSSFTYYIAKTNTPDQVDPTKIPILNDTIYVTKDTYCQNGTANRTLNYGSVQDVQTKLFGATGNAASFSKRTLAQYAVRRPNFNGRIGTVKLEMYFNTIQNAASMNFFEEQNVDWNESTVSWVTAPTFGSISIGSLSVTQAMRNTWANIDITSFYNAALTQGKTFVNIGGAVVPDLNTHFRSKEFSGGAFRSRLILSSPPVSIIRPVTNNPISVTVANPIKALSLNELKFEGTADKNISYTLTQAPQNGFLVLNGIPLVVNSSFTQEQVAKGVVKYLYNGTSPSTDALTLEARDFQGGIYNQLVNLTVNIR